MSKRIGEALLDKGLIDREQLAAALQSQLFFGGHLGTSLIELGFLSEHDLGETLAELHRVRYAPYQMLEDLAPKILDDLTPEQAEKYQAIPIKREGKTLHLAVVDPRQLSALSRITGCKIVPWICPETRVSRALQQYYGIPQQARHIKILEDLDRNVGEASTARPRTGAAANAAARVAPRGLRTAGAAAQREPHPATTMVDFGEQFGYGRSWRDVLDEVIEQDDVSWEKPGPESDEGAASRDEPQPTPRSVAETLSRVESKEQLAETVLSFVGESLQRCILFRVKGETAYVWDGVGLARKAESLKGVGFPLTAGSIFSLLLGESSFLGPLEEPQRYEWFYGTLGVEAPREALLVPVYVNDRLVAIVYGDHGKRGRIRGDVADYVHLGRKIGLALNMLVLKMRILS